MYIFDDCSTLDELIIKIKNHSLEVESLDIRGNLSPDEFSQLFQALNNSTVVKSLTLRGINSFDLNNYQIYSNFVKYLKINNRLKSLTLYHTNLDDESIISVKSSLSINNNLKYLKICGHQMTTKGQLHLVHMLTENNTLKDFILDYPALSPIATAALLPLSEFLSISSINAGNYHYTNDLTKSLPSSKISNEIFYSINANPISKVIDIQKRHIEILTSQLASADFKENMVEKIQDFLNDTLIRPIEKLAAKLNHLNQQRLDEMKSHTILTELERIAKAEYREVLTNEVNNIIREFNECLSEFNSLLYHDYHLMQDKLSLINITMNNEEEDLLYQNDELTASSNNIDTLCTSSDDEAVNFDVKDSDNIEKLKINATDEVGTFDVKDSTELQVKKKDMINPINPKSINIELENVTKYSGNATQYLNNWSDYVANHNYDYAVISVGSLGHENQQIPSFTSELTSAAILNMDLFSEKLKEAVSTSDSVSVNYLRSKIQAPQKYNFLTQQQIAKEMLKLSEADREAENNLMISQSALRANIIDLINSDKKVILISHISCLAPRIMLKEVLKDQNIMKHYENKFLFIQSYFNDCSSIVCKKDFIEFMVKPPLELDGNVQLGNNDTTSHKTQRDELLGSKLGMMHQNSMPFQSNENTYYEDDYGDRIYKSLDHIDAEGILSFLGSTNTYLDIT